MRFRTICLSVCLMAVTIVSRPASAACSNATLNGVFGYYHGRPGGGSILRIVTGEITADGVGNLTGSWTMSFNGTISTGTFAGSYSIAANCTGLFTFNNEDTSPAHFNIVLDDAHKGFQMIQTDAGYSQPGFGLAKGPLNCALTGKKQIFATNFLGNLFATSEIEAVVGQLILDGHGNISGSETFSIGGTISEVPISGTYTINGNCLGTAQITPSGSPTTNFNTVVVNNGKEMLLIETDNTTLIAGTAQQ